ncbi:MAG TPA: 16S rRNA (guanine(527)-N(7))-methyltransferase RsmG [Burkholderiales bacterium]
MTPREVIRDGAAQLAVPLSEAQTDQLLAYIDLLLKWNKVYNLTAVRDADAMLTQHLLDSLAVVPHIPPGRSLDVGSGPGLPGVPIAIVEPARSVSMLDSNTKKAAFIRQAAGALKLSNVSVHSHRVEEWAPEETFSLVISRAFAELRLFVEWCGHLIEPGGVLAAMKGVYPNDEIERLPKGFEVQRVVRLNVPGLEAERHLVLIGAV